MARWLGLFVVLLFSWSPRPDERVPPRTSPPFDVERLVSAVRSGFREAGAGWESATPGAISRVEHGGLTVRAPSPRQGGVSFGASRVTHGGVVLTHTTRDPRREVSGLLVTDFGRVRERFASGASGVEQSWEFPEPLDPAFSLEVRVPLREGAFIASTEGGLHFAGGALALRYGHGTWVDAKGTRWPVAARWSEGEVALSVSSEVLARTAWPAVLDPLVSAELAVDQPLTYPSIAGSVGPEVAFNGTIWLVAWLDGTDLAFVRVDQAGTLLDVTPQLFRRVSSDTIATPFALASDGSGFLLVVPLDDGFGNYILASIPLSAAGAYGAETVLTSVPGCTDPGLAWNGAEYLLTFTCPPGQVLYRRLSASGVPVGNAAAVGGGFTQLTPTVASDGTQWLVAWVDFRGPTPPDLYATRISAGGAVLDPTGLALSTADGGQSRPSAGWTGTSWLVAWEDSRNESAGDIFGARVTSAGAVQDPAGLAINVAPGVTQSFPFVTAGGGESFVAWSHRPSGGDAAVVGARVASTGAVQDPTPLVLRSGPLSRDRVRGAWGGPGAGWLMAWTDSLSASQLEVMTARVSPSATLAEGPMVRSLEYNTQTSPSLAWNGQHYLAVWADSRNGRDIYGVRLDEAGQPQEGTAFAISAAAGTEASPAVAWNGTDWLVAWVDSRAAPNTQLYAARVSAAGVVRDPAGIALRTTTGTKETPAVASDGTDWVVVWTEQATSGTTGRDLYRARVGANGTVLNAAGAVAAVAGPQANPTIAFGDGKYLVAWDDGRTSGNGLDIYAVRMTATGNSLDGTGVLVTSMPTAAQTDPALTFDGARFVLAWHDGRNGPIDLFARHVAAPDAGVLSFGGELNILAGATRGTLTHDGREVLALASTGSGLRACRLASDGGLHAFAVGPGGFAALAASGPREALVAYQRPAVGTPPTSRVFTRFIGNEVPAAAANSLSTAEEQAVQVALAGTDADLDPLDFAVATPPLHGTLSGAPPLLTFTPALNYAGADSFTFTASDGLATSAPATVTFTITPVNDAPTAVAQALTTPEDTPLVVQLGGLDVDGDALTAAVVSQPQHGTLSGTPPAVLYTPQASYVGADSFTFTVADGALTSAAETISLTVVAASDAPVATPQQLTTAEDSSLTLTLTGTDADGDALTFALATPPMHGQLSGTPPSLVYTPEPNSFGADAFTFTANDGTSDSSAATVSLTITPVNDAPTAAAVSVGTAPATPIEVTLQGDDPDGDPLSFSVVRQPESGTLAGAPPLLTFTPAPGISGVVTFTYSASDGTAVSAPALVTITVAEPPDVPVTPTELNGWSCGCGAAGDAGLWAALVALIWLARRKRLHAAWSALVVLTLVAAPALAAETRRSVAVPEVDITVKDATVDAESVTNVMTAALERAGVFRVITARDVAVLLGGERQKQLLGCGEDTSCSVELAAALGSDLVLQGSIGKLGNTFVVTARLLDTKDSRVVARRTLQVASLDLVLEAAWKVTQDALDDYATTRPEAEARNLAQRPREEAPPELVQSVQSRLRFGLGALAVGGWQPLAPAGARLTVGAEVLVTLRVRRFDLSASLVVSPNPGARLAASFAVLAAQQRLGVGVRATAFPGAGTFGGGPFIGFELGLGDYFALTATVASEFYGSGGGFVLALLGGLGVVGRY